MSMKYKTATLALLLLMVLPFAANAQTSRGTVTGTVLDPSSAVVGGAHITLTGVETGAQLSTNSNEAGVYRFDAVDLGAYDLTVENPGFRTYSATGINVQANRVTTLNPSLDVGTAETKIDVSVESSELLVKDSPLRGGNFQPREIRDLPLVSLNPLSLARTLTGAPEASGIRV